MCEECQQKQQATVARKAENKFNATEAPPLVADVLRSPGQPLAVSARNSLEGKLGQDLSSVRVHDDSLAAESASAVNALAFTVGSHIVFGAGQYTPGTHHGDRLLAHEVTHTIQQGGAGARQSTDASSFGESGTSVAAGTTAGVLQRACRPGLPECATGFPGDSGRFGIKTAAQQEEKKKASGPSPKSGPVTCQNPRHKERAVNFEKLVESEGVHKPPEVFGFFINACEAAGGGAPQCRDFPDGMPTGAEPDKVCVELLASDEDSAKAIFAKKTRTADDNAQVTYLKGVALHEGQHAVFDKDPGKIVSAGADCDLKTVIHPNPDPAVDAFRVSFYLSEISAETAEFAPYFQNTKTSPGKDSLEAMYDHERDMVLNPEENILGIIKTLQCKCDCDTVDKFVVDVVNNVIQSWPPDQKDEYLKAMTRMIPSYWPKVLKKT
jgi:hypothetical protein